MVIAIKNKLEIGKTIRDKVISTQDRFGNQTEFHQPFTVLRKATFEEWFEECQRELGPPPSDWCPPFGYNFYEVESD